MSPPQTHVTEHRISVRAPARAVFDLVADVTGWPRSFAPTVHVEYVARSETTERIRIWATANGQVRNWTSRRDLDPRRLRVRFRQEVSQPPVHGMGGEWIIEERPGGGCLVRLLHDFQAVGDDPAKAAWITQAVDHNSGSELASLKAAAERGTEGGELLLTFDDVVRVESHPADIYAFIHDAARWPERIPHVARVVLAEPAPDVQLLEMDTRTKDGSTHTTNSVRVCFPADRIVYKQLTPPALMTVHTGGWRFEPAGEGGQVISTHTVVLNPGAIEQVLGAGATVADAATFVREALSANSTTTIRTADEFAGRRPGAGRATG